MTTLELDNVYEEIVERGGPTQTLAILAFVSNQAVRDDLNKQIQRLDAAPRIRIEHQEHKLQYHIDFLQSTGASRLAFISAADVTNPISIPASFIKFHIIGRKNNDEYISICAQVTYCGVPLHSWLARQDHPTHEFAQHRNVYILPPDNDEPTSKSPVTKLKDIKKLVKQIVKTIENPKASCGTLPWIEGPAKGKPTVRITEVDIVEGGLRIVCVGASVGSVVGLAFGAPPMVGAVVGGFVALVGAALVYFVPWKKLWSWLTKGWVHLIRFLILIRAAIKVGIVDWLKKMITVLIGWARSRSGTSNYNAEEYFPLLVAT